MSKKILIYSAFFVGLTAIFYLIVRPWIKRNDTISTVQPFSFINQDGKLVNQDDLKGKVYVAEYFFTTCPGICPTMNTNLKRVYDRFSGQDGFLILSHTSDPERDSVPVLKRYADSLGVNTDQWIFLTGRKDSLYKTARLSYTIDDPANNLKSIEDDFLHTQFWALVNQNGEVKKVYDGLKEREINAMIKEIERMLKL
ncbi:MAG TPA: SCO family protein [Chitinophagaceae bacterium]|nr:SCO family protein [Chitinophagaceae bacterium]HUM64586.1 SCO family protein [Chitinophagaceae bacterium]